MKPKQEIIKLKAAHNKKIGNRADEVLLLGFCARLKSSNSIQHLC